MNIEPNAPVATYAGTDPVDWMYGQWESLYGGGADKFATMMAMMRAHQRVISAIDRILKQVGISRTAYLALISLQMSKNQTRPLGRLGKHLMVHPTTITMVIDQMEKSGFVERMPHPTDRRGVLARLTPEGVKVVNAASQTLRDGGFGFEPANDETMAQLSSALRLLRDDLKDVDG